MNDEIKEWKTRSVKHKVAFMLMSDGVSFRYNEEDGISAPESYVKKMTYRLMTCYGCIRRPVIEEY